MHRLALPLWVITVILFFILLKYGAYFLMLTGLTMVGANIAWASLRNVNELIIPFSAEHKLEFHFGSCFFVNLVTGLDITCNCLRNETLFDCKIHVVRKHGFVIMILSSLNYRYFQKQVLRLIIRFVNFN